MNNQPRKPKTAPKLKQPYKSPVNGQTVMLTDSQRQFTEAALAAPTSEVLINRVQEIYQTNRKAAKVIARQNFLKPNIIEYLGDRGYRAVDVLTEAMEAKDASWSDKINAAKDIADRHFGKAVQRSQNQSTHLIRISLGNIDNE